ncbi:amidohydrolase [Photobacterium sp. GB-27]|uniref:amidohydrolase n=1 Tax=unclassified Photobacterium TaxID=2628852 RepID=UPI000D162536|nr:MULTISPECIES: amidohydrolase [unclassified Photobacterium]PSV28238.1 amidohydrolase [Photobacterium sp. GB-56]PSV32503.1 amidohydrolase [Photobacterium sp. GB-72]PSV38797.1 amidohydrolase [Photobacterium sp. GB-27]PSV40025.1 amidohydrolase [Photobacterium sp. GB-210]PSV47163.1 amidohydrolase [Photobacterium sp. GB-36]
MFKRSYLSLAIPAILALSGCDQKTKTESIEPQQVTKPTSAAVTTLPAKLVHHADTIYSGGDIITINDKQPEVEAVAVKNGKILATGSLSDIEKHKNAETNIVDLKGNTLIPGFVDAHGHVFNVGLQALSANLLPPPDGEGRDINSLIELTNQWHKDFPERSDKVGWIIGFGYDDSQLTEKRHPTAEDLDKISTELPVILIHQSGHLAAVNNKALEVAGVTDKTEDPEGGVFVRKKGSQQPNGTLEENAFYYVLGKVLANMSNEDNEKIFKAGMELYSQFGYTTGQEGRAFPNIMPIMQKVSEEGNSPIDVVAYPDIVIASQTISGPYLSNDYKNNFRIGGAKLTIDGSPQGKTAWLTQPYFEPPKGKDGSYVGYSAISNNDTFKYVDQAFENNWQILAHANGDAAIDVFIAAVKQAEDKYGKKDRRPVLIHGQTIRPDQINSLKELGIFPSLFPMHTYYWGDWHRDSVLGPERAEFISPTKTVYDKGIKFSSHHDAPVALPDSMRVLSATVNRRSRTGDIIGPTERVSPLIGLKAMTIWPAYQHFEEDKKGSIEVGKEADFVILSDNPLKIDPLKIEDIKIQATINDGKTVYQITQ